MLELDPSRIFRPPRPNLRACLEVVREGMSGEQAWNALAAAELIPRAWVANLERLFDTVPDNNLRVSGNLERPPGPALAPPTVAACVAFASCGAQAIEEVERLASELQASLAKWKRYGQGRKRPLRAWTWELVPIGGAIPPRNLALLPDEASFAFDAARYAVAQAAADVHREAQQRIEQDEQSLRGNVEQVIGTSFWKAGVARARWWALACELDLLVPADLENRDHGLGRVPRSLVGRRFAELPDPTAGVCAIVAWGFGCGSVGEACAMFATRPQLATLRAEA